MASVLEFTGDEEGSTTEVYRWSSDYVKLKSWQLGSNASSGGMEISHLLDDGMGGVYALGRACVGTDEPCQLLVQPNRENATTEQFDLEQPQVGGTAFLLHLKSDSSTAVVAQVVSDCQQAACLVENVALHRIGHRLIWTTNHSGPHIFVGGVGGSSTQVGDDNQKVAW